MSASDDLNTMLNNLNALEQQSSDADSVQIDQAIAAVEDALTELGAQQILQLLPDPNSEQGRDIRAMIGKMNAAANSINNQVKDVTKAVTIATGFASLVTSLAGGNIEGAMGAVNSLQGFL